MQERLLKRISRWQDVDNNSMNETEINDLVLSIRDDLAKLYNTRKGTVLIDDDFGLEDFAGMFNGYAAPDVEKIQRALLQLTRLYEKRLTSISVEFREEKNTDNLCFYIAAFFEHKKQNIPFTTNAYLRGDGSITLEA